MSTAMDIRYLLKRIERVLLPPDDDLGRLPYAWLVYLGFLFFPLTLGAGGREFWLPTLTSIVVFLPLYFWTLRLSGWNLLLGTVPMVGLCALLTPYNPSALTFAVYAAAFAPGFGSVRAGLIHLAGVIVAITGIFWFYSLPMPFFIMGILMPLLVGLSNVFFTEMQKKNAEIKLSQQEVRRLAGKAERERIARDMHDLLGHTLAVMVRKAELARRLVDTNPEQAAIEMKAVEAVGRDALAQVREAVSGWRAPELAAEAASARLVLESSGISAEVDDIPDIEREVGQVLAMVLREAVTNVIRHSGASQCRIEFQREQRNWLMRVVDNGSGKANTEGNGITGMRERLAAIGGELSLDFQQGCTLLARVPQAMTEKAA
ncbi:MAG: sensor histidine kinase [Wenzhouxiangella sp.]|nr:sensor histidine kinase [Wenzhouxiangella sp.]